MPYIPAAPVVLVPLEKGRTYYNDSQVGLDFDEDAHPRAPKGGPHGGEFVKKDEVEKFPVQYRRHGHPTPETRLVSVPPNEPQPTSPPALETFENAEDGVKSYVVAVPRGFSVSVQDTDTGEFLPSVPIYKTLEEAKVKAKEAAFGRSPAPTGGPERKTQPPTGGEIIEARGKKEADRINAALYNAYGYHAKIVHQHGGYILKDTGLDAETAHDLMFLLGTSIASKKVTQELIEGARAKRIAQAAENARQYDEMLAAREANAGRFAYKKEAPAGPIHHATYTGPRHTYGLTNRPAGYSHIPEGWVVGSEKEHPDYRHGTVDYPRPLTEQEQRSYELEPVHPHEEGGLSVKDMRHARAFAEDMARDGWTGQEKKDLDALQAAIDAGPRALADFLRANQDTNDFAYTLAGNVTLKKAFPVLKIAPLPEDTAHDAQGGPPPAKPFLIPHAKRPRRHVPNRQGGGGAVLNEEETDRTNLVLDPPVLIPFEKSIASGDTGPSEPNPLPPITGARTSAEEITAQNVRDRIVAEVEGVITQTPAAAVDAANAYAPSEGEVLDQAADYAAILAWMKEQTDAGYWLNVEQPVGPRENMSRFLANQKQAMEAAPVVEPDPLPEPAPRFLVQVTVNVEPAP